MAVLTGIYVVVGGYMAVALNDMVQGIIMILGIIAIIAVVLHDQGGLMAAMSNLSQVQSPTLPQFKGVFTSFFGPDPMTLLGVVILTSLGTWGLPQMVHKFYTIRDEKAIQTGTIISTVFALIISGGCYFNGSFGHLYYKGEADGTIAFDNIVPTMIGHVMPAALIGLTLVMVLSASMSTLSSLVMTSSSTFTLDFLRGTMFPKMEKKTQVVTIKALCIVFVLFSVIIALNPNNLITTLMSLSWGTLAGSFLGPFLYGLFMKRTTKTAVWVSIIFAVSFNTLNLFNMWFAPPVAGAIAMILSLIIVPLVSPCDTESRCRYRRLRILLLQ